MTRRRRKQVEIHNEQARGTDNSVSFQIEGPAVTTAFVLSIEAAEGAALKGVAPSTVERSAESRLAETVRLARAIDLEIVGEEIAVLNKVRPSTLLGSGKVDEIGAAIRAADAELVVVNAQLTPGQQRNLEKAWKAKVLDQDRPDPGDLWPACPDP